MHCADGWSNHDILHKPIPRYIPYLRKGKRYQNETPGYGNGQGAPTTAKDLNQWGLTSRPGLPLRAPTVCLGAQHDTKHVRLCIMRKLQ